MPEHFGKLYRAIKSYKSARQLFIIAEEIDFCYRGVTYTEVENQSTIARTRHWVIDTTFSPTISDWPVRPISPCDCRCKNIYFHPTDHFVLTISNDWRSFTFCVTAFRGARDGKESFGKIVFYKSLSNTSILWFDAIWSPCGKYIMGTEYTAKSYTVKLYSFNASKTEILTTTFKETHSNHLQPPHCWLGQNMFFVVQFYQNTILQLQIYQISESKSAGSIKKFSMQAFPSFEQHHPADVVRLCGGYIASIKKIIFCAAVKCVNHAAHYNSELSLDENNNYFHHNIYLYTWDPQQPSSAMLPLRILFLSTIILDMTIDLKLENLILAYFFNSTYKFTDYSTTSPMNALLQTRKINRFEELRLGVGDILADCPFGKKTLRAHDVANTRFSRQNRLESMELSLNILYSPQCPPSFAAEGMHLCYNPGVNSTSAAIVQNFLDRYKGQIGATTMAPKFYTFIHSVSEYIYLIGNTNLGQTFTLIRHHDGIGGRLSSLGHYARHPTKPFFIAKQSLLDRHNCFDIGMMLYADPDMQKQLAPALTSFYKAKKRYKMSSV